MANFYISDMHFFDEDIIRTANRPHKDIKEMHTDIIIKWNKAVKKEDTVYILGDVGVPNNMSEEKELIKILNSLNGEKILIIGNHDRALLERKSFRDCFSHIKEYLRVYENGKRIILFHCPIEEWEGMRKKSIHFHGHIHKKFISDIKNRYHVGCDVQKFTPLTLDEIIKNKEY